MISLGKYVGLVVLIIVMAFSISICAYTVPISMSMNMDMNGMQSMPDMPVSNSHIDHAHLLNTGIIPTLLVLIVFFVALFIFHKTFVARSEVCYWYAIENDTPLPYWISKRNIYSPRSPPVLEFLS